MTFKSPQRNSLPEEIVSNLLTLIMEKRLRPGDRLPSERELTAMMQVSRPSLREALRALAIMKVIEIRQGDGTYVTSLEPKLLVEHLGFVFSLDDYAFLELFEARRAIEPGIVALAAQKITARDIAELEECLRSSIENVDDHPAFIEADIRLHDLISQVANNSLLSRIVASVSELTRASRMRTTEIAGVPNQVVEDHRKIIEALKAQDPDAAKQAMLAHLNHVEQSLRSAIPGSPEEGEASRGSINPSG